MGVDFIVDEDFLGIRNAERYEIEDNEKTFQEWQNLHADFMKAFGRFSSPEDADYEFPEWHHGMRQLGVYLYSERFYDRDFLGKIEAILDRNPGSFAHFECYDNGQDFLGDFQVYTDQIVFDTTCRDSGLIQLLIPEADVGDD